MRFVVYIALVGLALLASISGQLALALGLGGIKACLVGSEYMELRWAHPAHRFGFAAGIGALVLALSLVALPS
jgi:hypothetical protein